MKYYTFTATETVEPFYKWFLAAGIDEASFTGALSKLCGHEVSLERSNIHLLAVGIIYRKSKSLLAAHTEGKSFLFSSLDPLETADRFGAPAYETGGLSIWLLEPAG